MIMVDDKPATKEQFIEIMVSLGMSEDYAEFSWALEQGEIDGDVIDLSTDGKSLQDGETWPTS